MSSSCPWLILAPKVFQLCTNHLVLVLCRFMWIIKACEFFLVPSRSSCTPLYPSRCYEPRRGLDSLFFHCFQFGTRIWVRKGVGSTSRSISRDTQLAWIFSLISWRILVMTRSNVFTCQFASDQRCHKITVWWEPSTSSNRRDTYYVRNVDNFDAMDLADANNEIMAANDEEVFNVSSS